MLFTLVPDNEISEITFWVSPKVAAALVTEIEEAITGARQWRARDAKRREREARAYQERTRASYDVHDQNRKGGRNG